MAEQYARVNFTMPGIQLEGQARTTIEPSSKYGGKWSVWSATTELGKGVLLFSQTSERGYFVPIDKIDYVELTPEHCERLIKAFEGGKSEGSKK